MTIEATVACGKSAKVTLRSEICRGCASVSESLGITLSKPHLSCRKVTLENIAEAARHLGVPLIDMFKPPEE